MSAEGFLSICWVAAALFGLAFGVSDVAFYSALIIATIWGATDRIIVAMEKR